MAALGTISIVSNNVLLRDASGRPAVREIKIAWVGSADDGSVPVLPIPGCVGLILDQLVVKPGTPNPTAAYDIALTDADAGDLAAAALANLSATVPLTVVVTNRARIGSGGFSVTITGNAVHSAEGILKIFLSKER